MKRLVTTLLITGLLLVTMLSCFSYNANANGVGTIEVKVTLFGKFPILNAEVTGENVNNHDEKYEGLSAKNGTYYINVWYMEGPPVKKDIEVKVITKYSGVKDEIVYGLGETDFVELRFDFGFKEKSRALPLENHWNFPVMSRILRFLFNNVLI